MVVRVPLFIAIGEVVRVDASKRDARYEKREEQIRVNEMRETKRTTDSEK